jgi:hypothetical protein
MEKQRALGPFLRRPTQVQENWVNQIEYRPGLKSLTSETRIFAAMDLGDTSDTIRISSNVVGSDLNLLQ